MHSWRSARTFKLCSRLLIVRSSLSQAHRQPEATACRRLPATPSSPPFPLPQSPMLGAIRPAHAKAPRKVHTRDLIQLQHMARRQMACGQQRDQKGRDRNEHLTRTGLLTSSFVSSILAGHFVLFTRPAALSTNRATSAYRFTPPPSHEVDKQNRQNQSGCMSATQESKETSSSAKARV